MKRWLKRIDAAVGMGLTWAVALAIVALLFEVFDAVFLGGSAWDILVAPLGGAFFGFIGGSVFSVALAVAGRRRSFDEMSLPRFAAWGALVPSLIIVALEALWPSGTLYDLSGLGFTTVSALMGAGFAAGTLALARKAEDRELLEAGEGALGLAEGEAAQ